MWLGRAVAALALGKAAAASLRHGTPDAHVDFTSSGVEHDEPFLVFGGFAIDEVCTT